MISCVKVKVLFVGICISSLLAGKSSKHFLIFSSHSVGRMSGEFCSTSIVLVEVVEVETSLETSPVVVIITGPELVVGVILVLEGRQLRLFIITQS